MAARAAPLRCGGVHKKCGRLDHERHYWAVPYVVFAIGMLALRLMPPASGLGAGTETQQEAPASELDMFALGLVPLASGLDAGTETQQNRAVSPGVSSSPGGPEPGVLKPVLVLSCVLERGFGARTGIEQEKRARITGVGPTGGAASSLHRQRTTPLLLSILVPVFFGRKRPHPNLWHNTACRHRPQLRVHCGQPYRRASHCHKPECDNRSSIPRSTGARRSRSRTPSPPESQRRVVQRTAAAADVTAGRHRRGRSPPSPPATTTTASPPATPADQPTQRQLTDNDDSDSEDETFQLSPPSFVAPDNGIDSLL